MKLHIKKISLQSISLFFISLYILLSYIAQDGIMDETIQQFIMWCMLIINTLLIVSSSACRKKNNYFIWYGCLLLYAFISCLYSPNKSYSFQSVYSMFVTLLIACSISQIINTDKDIKLLIKTFSISGFVLFILMYKNNLLIVGERLGTSLFSNANIFAMLVLISLICSIYLVFSSTARMKIVYIFFSIVQFYMLFLSAGRKYILISVLFIIVLYLLKNGINKFKTIIKTIILIIVLFSLGYYILFKIPFFYDLVGYRFENTIDSIILGVSSVEDSGDIVRSDMIRYGMQYFLEKPIFGFGQSGFAILFNNDYGRLVYSHNNYVELLANLGLFGFLFYYVFYFKTFFKLIKQKKVQNNPLSDFFITFLFVVFLLDFGIVSYYSQNILQIFIALSIKMAFRKVSL